jgi:hypothetical protein
MAIAVSAVLKTIARDAFEPREEFLKGVELVANMIRDREGEELQ